MMVEWWLVMLSDDWGRMMVDGWWFPVMTRESIESRYAVSQTYWLILDTGGYMYVLVIEYSWWLLMELCIKSIPRSQWNMGGYLAAGFQDWFLSSAMGIGKGGRTASISQPVSLPADILDIQIGSMPLTSPTRHVPTEQTRGPWRLPRTERVRFPPNQHTRCHNGQTFRHKPQ